MKIFIAIIGVLLISINSYAADTIKHKQTKEDDVSSQAILPEHASNEYIYSFTKDYVESLHLAKEAPSSIVRLLGNVNTSENPNKYIAMLSTASKEAIETLKRANQMMMPYLQSSNGFVKMIADNTVLAYSSLIEGYELALRHNNILLAAKTEAQVIKINKEIKKQKDVVTPAWKMLSNSSVMLTQCMVLMGSKGKEKPDTLILTSKQRKDVLKMLVNYYGPVIKGGRDEDLVWPDIPAAILWKGVENKDFKSYKK